MSKFISSTALAIAAGWFTLAAIGAETDAAQLTSRSLLLDLDATKGVSVDENGRVTQWLNQAPGPQAREFVPQPKGRKVPDSGRPTLHQGVRELAGKASLMFRQQELLCADEDTFDGLTTGKGHTWVALVALDEQRVGLKDVNSFFGNLRNGGNYEGLWGCVKDDNTVWYGARSGVTFGRFDKSFASSATPSAAATTARSAGCRKMEILADGNPRCMKSIRPASTLRSTCFSDFHTRWHCHQTARRCQGTPAVQALRLKMNWSESISLRQVGLVQPVQRLRCERPSLRIGFSRTRSRRQFCSRIHTEQTWSSTGADHSSCTARRTSQAFASTFREPPVRIPIS